jgi:hypothetical protein
LTGEREVIRQDEDGEWICPNGEEVLQMAGVLTIEEYAHSEEARDDHEIHKMRNICGNCKSSQKIDSNLLWLDYNHYSNDAAEALTSQAPGGKNPPCMPPASTHGILALIPKDVTLYRGIVLLESIYKLVSLMYIKESPSSGGHEESSRGLLGAAAESSVIFVLPQ